jgi:hypothetical protein
MADPTIEIFRNTSFLSRLEDRTDTIESIEVRPAAVPRLLLKGRVNEHVVW